MLNGRDGIDLELDSKYNVLTYDGFDMRSVMDKIEFEAKVSKQGNGLGILIPGAKKNGIEKGDKVKVVVEKQGYDLDAILDAIPDDYTPEELDRSQVGKEVIE